MTTAIELIGSIDEDDIAWVVELMGLLPLDEPRREFLMSLDSMDVSACPGSGKTTLIVAKLAILARKWQSRTQGICVLSHTNVAKEEIHTRLAGTEVGHRLLGFPHYIDTIHGFVNRFLAIPWLLSKGHSVTAIDNEITTRVRMRHMGGGLYKVRVYLEKKKRGVEGLRLTSADFTNPLVGSNFFPPGSQSDSYKIAAQALKATAEQGYFCHDEMLLLGETQLQERPDITSILSRRFPIVLLDEMQDTDEQQGRILDLALPLNQVAFIQRVGDPNQAIFDDSGTKSGSVFPDASRKQHSLSSSYRFDLSVASLASNLAVTAVGSDGLKGLRQTSDDDPPGANSIFVFPDDDTSKVLPAFATHVQGVMDAVSLQHGKVAAVGDVHKQRDDISPGHSDYPASVCHYWDGYQPRAAGGAARAGELVEVFRAARMLAAKDRSAEAVNAIASGIALVANSASESPSLRLGARSHRAAERLLTGNTEVLAAYRSLLVRAVFSPCELDITTWRELLPVVRSVAGTLLGCSSDEIPANNEYLRWVPAAIRIDDDEEAITPPNVYRFRDGERFLDVHLSSIHAVKGQTHLATLVLETHFYDHSLKKLLPWLKGAQSGGSGAGVRDQRRLRMTYVAMTRPTHIVCLAMPQSSLGPSAGRNSAKSELESHGWRVVDLSRESS